MSREESLIQIATGQLDRVLTFFERSDGKFTGMLAVDAGLLAIICLNVHPEDFDNRPIVGALGLAAIFLITSLLHLYLSYSPHLRARVMPSLVYFGDISTLNEKDFMQRFQAQTDRERLEDLLSQISRNSEILTIKFRRLQMAFVFTALSILPWLAFLTLVSIKHMQMPRFMS